MSNLGNTEKEIMGEFEICSVINLKKYSLLLVSNG